MSAPVVFQYQQALDEFRREGREPPLLKRMSELISLLDLTVTLGSSVGGAEILDAALLIVMGELQVSRAALFVAEGEGRYRRARRGACPPRRRTVLDGAGRGGAVRPGAGRPRRRGDRPRVPGAQGGPAPRAPRSRARGPGPAVRGRGAGLSREPRRLRGEPDRERAHLRGAAAGQPRAVRQGLPAPQPLRHRPRAERRASTRRRSSGSWPRPSWATSSPRAAPSTGSGEGGLSLAHARGAQAGARPRRASRATRASSCASFRGPRGASTSRRGRCGRPSRGAASRSWCRSRRGSG